MENDQNEIKTFKLSELDELKQVELDSEDLLLVSDSTTATNKKYISKKLAISTLVNALSGAIDQCAIKPIRDQQAVDEAAISKLSSDEELSCVKYDDVNGGKDALSGSNKIATLDDVQHTSGGATISVDGEEVNHFAACHISYNDYAKKMLSSELDEDTLYVVGNDSIICYDKKLTRVGEPQSVTDACTKRYVDAIIEKMSSQVQSSIDNMTYQVESKIEDINWQINDFKNETNENFNKLNSDVSWCVGAINKMQTLLQGHSYNFSNDEEVKSCIRTIAESLGAYIYDNNIPMKAASINSIQPMQYAKKVYKPIVLAHKDSSTESAVMTQKDKNTARIANMMKRRLNNIKRN